MLLLIPQQKLQFCEPHQHIQLIVNNLIMLRQPLKILLNNLQLNRFFNLDVLLIPNHVTIQVHCKYTPMVKAQISQNIILL